MKRFVALFLLLAAPAAFAGTVTVTWVAPTSCADGSPIAEGCPLTGYEVWQGTSINGTAYTLRETVAGTVTSVTYTNVPPGTRCFYLKAVAGTLKSAESVRGCANVPYVAPGSPTGVTVVTVALPAPLPTP